jgi:hypothetical protein
MCGKRAKLSENSGILSKLSENLMICAKKSDNSEYSENCAEPGPPHSQKERWSK